MSNAEYNEAVWAEERTRLEQRIAELTVALREAQAVVCREVCGRGSHNGDCEAIDNALNAANAKEKE